MKTKQEILETLKEAIKNASLGDMENVSWIDQYGILFRGNFIEEVIDLLEEKEYTAREWFNKAKDLGYDWADEAIERTSLNGLDSKWKSMAQAVAYSFSWGYGEAEEERCGNRSKWHRIYELLNG